MSNVIVMDFSDQIFKDLHGLENVLVAEQGEMSVSAKGLPCWKLTDIKSYDINNDGIFHVIKNKILLNISLRQLTTILFPAIL